MKRIVEFILFLALLNPLTSYHNLISVTRLMASQRPSSNKLQLSMGDACDDKLRGPLRKIVATLAVCLPLYGNFPPAPLPSVAPSHAAAEVQVGKTSVEGEASRIFLKARSCESDGDFVSAQKFYEEVISVEPDFIYAWSNLGNVLTAEGNLDQALLCYKKAISLRPPRDMLSVILLNKAAIELSVNSNVDAIRDLDMAERLSGPTNTILTNRAVAYSNEGEWGKACQTFERVISSADRNALPWWLRYAMSLLETSRSMEAVAYVQRTLNRFPDEPECRAFAAALYTALGSKQEALAYWEKLPDADKRQFSSAGFVSDKLRWGPKATKSFQDFLQYAKVDAS